VTVALDLTAGTGQASARRAGRLVRLPGLTPYGEAHSLMRDLAAARLRDDVPDTLLLVEHEPVFTAGSSTRPEHLRWTEDAIRASGAALVVADRGGSVTFHGPGQLVAYPIVHLGERADVVGYLRDLEDVVIAACADAGVSASRDAAGTGVWANGAKVCAIGVRVKRGRVAMHGFALNCSTDLAWFDAIVPCGIGDRAVTSLSAVAGRAVSVDDMVPFVVRRFGERFGLEL
jgi:lipoyl(octanoyl) transferase